MNEFIPQGDPVGMVFDREIGLFTIEGWAHDSMFIAMGACYEWDGESSFCMIERSLPDAR